jgi:hypothetical protein
MTNNNLFLACLVISSFGFGACDTDTSTDPNQVYNCVGTFVCNDVESTYPGQVCTDAAGAQDQVDGWVTDCDNTAVEDGCTSYSCYDDCQPTGNAC